MRLQKVSHAHQSLRSAVNAIRTDLVVPSLHDRPIPHAAVRPAGLPCAYSRSPLRLQQIIPAPTAGLPCVYSRSPMRLQQISHDPTAGPGLTCVHRRPPMRLQQVSQPMRSGRCVAPWPPFGPRRTVLVARSSLYGRSESMTASFRTPRCAYTRSPMILQQVSHDPTAGLPCAYSRSPMRLQQISHVPTADLPNAAVASRRERHSYSTDLVVPSSLYGPRPTFHGPRPTVLVPRSSSHGRSITASYRTPRSRRTVTAPRIVLAAGPASNDMVAPWPRSPRRF
jgi:hypothetical protein